MQRQGRILLLTGGARSGKSEYALTLAKQRGDRLAFVATAEPLDEEMQQRILSHRRQRGTEWITYEEPLEITHLLSRIHTSYDVVVVDCITVWVSNLLLKLELEAKVRQKVSGLVEFLRRDDLSGEIIFVTNEVGMGIVPETSLARRFRDLAGWTNQQLASIADEVYLMVSGIPLKIKEVSDA